MWPPGYRDELWARIAGPWDILIIGGGITGAGILREATRLGLTALLVEQRDFAWGTSSRSSKLVHGGLRYLKEGKFRLTRAAVQERERLLKEGPGLIDPLGFLLATYKGDRPGRRMYRLGLSIYDLLALQWTHRYYSAADFRLLAPYIAADDLEGGFRYGDAQTDDARLVLRVIQEAVAAGAAALNYVGAEQLLRSEASGPVIGARVRDLGPAGRGRTADVYARVVINATGAWADRLRGQVGAPPRIRPLRGSHLIFPAERLPVAQALSFLHPVDRRPVFIFPWEGVTLVGTTDVDHDALLDDEPAISPQEVAYLMAAVEAQYPALGLTLDDVVSTYAGVRPVIGTGKADPSREARDHVVWVEDGLLTVTGGKLTTFRRIALDALRAVRGRLPTMPRPDAHLPVLDPVDLSLPELSEDTRRRLLGRYGADAAALVAAAGPQELALVPGTTTLWAELRWGARSEAVLHLDDLLLRRTRLGLLLPQGAASILPRARAICQAELGWDDARWQAEEDAYRALWQRCYSLPDRAAIPDWRAMLAQARATRAHMRQKRRRSWTRRAIAAGTSLLFGIGGWAWRRTRKTRPRG
ncbi:MAG: glycerol-3-phosphate dehydrogenase/oxidase [Anaerolineae bacterium]